MRFNGLRRTVAPAIEPLSLTDARAWLKVDHNDEDNLIQSAIVAARSAVEEYTGRALINQTWTVTAPCIPGDGFVIPRPPIVSMTSLEYATDATTWAPWTDYRIDLLEEPARLRVNLNPGDSFSREDKWRLTYVTGYGTTAESVPLNITSAIKLIVASLYENRGGEAGAIPQSAKWLLDPFRVINL